MSQQHVCTFTLILCQWLSYTESVMRDWPFSSTIGFHRRHTLHFYHHFTRPCMEYIIRLCVSVRCHVAGGDQRSRISAHMCTCESRVAQQNKHLRGAATTALALLCLSSALETTKADVSHSPVQSLAFILFRCCSGSSP